MILYGRDNCRIAPTTLEALCDACRNLIGYKDGIGDIELFVAQQALMSERLVYIGGLPTAEMFAAPYLAMGCSTYSSAIANFAPKLAFEFYDAILSNDTQRTSGMLERFVLPYVDIRNRGAGYAVAIVKAAMRIVGRNAGPVRPPLEDLQTDHFRELEALILREIEVLKS
ncbi:dihydrodipicolinate synthase/N-acetylneuraminate lyase [Erythrobacter lutimaris]|nr:dihydrodipicolinate synthase/N-acetylneuraminate lyase [Alteriqipengyuania lutimaris]